MADIGEDAFWQGRIRLRQYQNGYRFSIDAVLLAFFARPNPGEAIMDLGTGCGIIPLLLTCRHPDISILGVELQPSLAELARENICLNARENRISILREDIRKLPLPGQQGQFDRVVSNPPYRKVNSGRVNPASQKAVARHELSVTLEDIVRVSAALLRKGGRLDIIYKTDRMTDLLSEMRLRGIEPKEIRMIHPDPLSPSTMLLVSGVRGANPGGVVVGPPLLLHEPDGSYTREVADMLSPESVSAGESEQGVDRQSGNNLRVEIS